MGDTAPSKITKMGNLMLQLPKFGGFDIRRSALFDTRKAWCASTRGRLGLTGFHVPPEKSDAATLVGRNGSLAAMWRRYRLVMPLYGSIGRIDVQWIISATPSPDAMRGRIALICNGVETIRLLDVTPNDHRSFQQGRRTCYAREAGGGARRCGDLADSTTVARANPGSRRSELV